jgi:outer membrane immunogenic protein
MRKQFLASVAAAAITAALCGPVQADDASPSQHGDWTGFYAGLHAGGGTLDVTEGGLSVHSGTGFAGGGQVGYNWQTSDWVLGFEGDVSGTALSARRFSSLAARVNLLSSLRARVGMTFDNILVYATGGGALANGKTYTSLSTGTNFTTFGGVVGGGVEIAFDPRWTTRAESLYYIYDQTETAAFKINNAWVWRIAISYRL